MAITSINDILNNDKALADFNNLPRQERSKLLGRFDSDYTHLKPKEQFRLLDQLESHKPAVNNEPNPRTNPLAEQAMGAVKSLPLVTAMQGPQAAATLGGGAGVGVERAITAPQGTSPKERTLTALSRANAAVQPGYEPQEGEKLGHLAGSIAGGLAIPSGEIAAQPSLGKSKQLIDSLEKEAGIDGRTLADTIQSASKKRLISIVQKLEQHIDLGGPLTPQQAITGKLAAKELLKGSSDMIRSQRYQQWAKFQEALNDSIKGRGQAARDYANALSIEDVKEGIGRLGKKALGYALAGAVGAGVVSKGSKLVSEILGE